MTDARPTAVVVLAAGEGTRMRSATPKVLHALGGRTCSGTCWPPPRRSAPDAPSSSSAPAGSAVDAHLAEIAPARAPGRAGRAARHRPRRPRSRWTRCPSVDGTGGGAATATCRCCGRRRCAALVDEHHERRRGRHRADRRGARPDRLRPDRPRRRAARSAAIVEQRDATDERAGDPRDQRRRLRVRRRRCCADALARLSTDNAQGEEYLTDVLGLLVAGRRCRSARVRGRRRRRDRRAQRPGRARRRAPALQRPAARRAGCGPGSPSSTRRPPGSTSTVDARAGRRPAARAPSCTAATTVGDRRRVGPGHAR